MRVHSVMDVSPESSGLKHEASSESCRLPFFLQSHGVFNARRNYVTDREGMESFLLMYTLDGCGSIEQRRTHLALPVNHAVLISCREHHRYGTAQFDSGPAFWNFLYIHLDGCGVESLFKYINGSQIRTIHLDDPARQQFLDAVTDLYDLSHPLQDLQLSVLLQQMLVNLAQCRPDRSRPELPLHYQAIMAEAMQYIRNHLQESLTLDQIIKPFNLSKYHFSRLFRQYAGQSPYAWLISQRISASKNLLRDSNLSLAEIAARTGFGDLNHFVRVFRQSTGITPRHYRQENYLL